MLKKWTLFTKKVVWIIISKFHQGSKTVLFSYSTIGLFYFMATLASGRNPEFFFVVSLERMTPWGHFQINWPLEKNRTKNKTNKLEDFQALQA